MDFPFQNEIRRAAANFNVVKGRAFAQRVRLGLGSENSAKAR